MTAAPIIWLCAACPHAEQDHTRAYEYNEDGVACAAYYPCEVIGCPCTDFTHGDNADQLTQEGDL